MMIRPFTPFWPHSSTTCPTAPAGTTMIARSTASGISRIDGYALIEWMYSAFGLTGNSFPWKSPEMRLCTISRPIAPSRFDAPTTAIDFGRKIASSDSGG